jgi:hypothetical protein
MEIFIVRTPSPSVVHFFYHLLILVESLSLSIVITTSDIHLLLCKFGSSDASDAYASDKCGIAIAKILIITL